MKKQIMLEKILLEAKKTKKINMLEIDKLELDDKKIADVINFLTENDIKDVSEENGGIKEDLEMEKYINDSVTMYLNEISMYKLLDSEEEKQLFNLYNQGDMNARKKIIESNLRLVIKPAKKYYNTVIKKPSIDFLDLIQGGNVGLVKAVEKFDVNKNYKFSTYAVWWIRQSIKRVINENKNTIKIPEYMINLIQKLKRFENEFLFKNNRMPQLEEYIENIDETKENIVLALEAEKEVTSLDMPCGDEDTTLENFIYDSIDDYWLADNRMLVNEILKLASPKLTEVEMGIIILRFGINGNRYHTLEEVGKIYNLTRERIRQKEMKALRKIRYVLKQKEFIVKTR